MARSFIGQSSIPNEWQIHWPIKQVPPSRHCKAASGPHWLNPRPRTHNSTTEPIGGVDNTMSPCYRTIYAAEKKVVRFSFLPVILATKSHVYQHTFCASHGHSPNNDFDINTCVLSPSIIHYSTPLTLSIRASIMSMTQTNELYTFCKAYQRSSTELVVYSREVKQLVRIA